MIILLKIFSVESVREKGFHLDLEDYLIGLLQLPSELVISNLIFSNVFTELIIN